MTSGVEVFISSPSRLQVCAVGTGYDSGIPLRGVELFRNLHSGRKPNDGVQVYFDTEKEEWRCFKKCNLVRIG